MYFVTGGAFNGKSKWVKAYNQLTPGSCYWVSAYQHDSIPLRLDDITDDSVVLEGMEQVVKDWLAELDGEAVQKKWQLLLNQWLSWESGDQNRKVILIGTDITKGIVPINSKDRIWRDVTGRIFQDTASSCERVDLVWYGLNKRLK